MTLIFYIKRNTTENLDAHTVGTSWIMQQFWCSLMKIRALSSILTMNIQMNLVMIHTHCNKTYNEKIYWEWRGRMFGALNRSLQESLFLVFVVILIAFFVTWKYLYFMKNYPRKWYHNSKSNDSKHSRPSLMFLE